MRLVTYRDETGVHPGVQDGAAVRALQGYGDLLEVIAGAVPLTELEGGRGDDVLAASLAAPIPRPAQNIICLGRNYREHASEMSGGNARDPERPTFFTKAVSSVIGPNDDIPYDPELTTQLDWEVELAFVIGRRARHVHPEEALRYVFGYMVLNDISARDLQYGYGGQYFLGKSLDGSCPTGPCLVTADEVPDPHALTARLCVNGEVKQEASTGTMIFDIPTIIATLSRAMTLEPGQIVATGTPAGVGYARKPQEFLRPGDLVEAEVDGIGALRNTVRGAGEDESGRP